MQTRGLFHRLDTKYRPLEKLDGDGDRTMLTCTYVYVLLYEGKCKWSYGPSYHVDFPLNIFIHSQWLKCRPDGTVILSLECRQLFIYGNLK